MTRHEKSATFLAPCNAQGRRRARRLDRRTGHVRFRARGRRRDGRRHAPPLTPGSALLLHRRQCRRHRRRFLRQDGHGAGAVRRRRADRRRKSSMCRSRASRFSWATPRPASIKAARPARPASRKAASRCAWPPPKRGASSSDMAAQKTRRAGDQLMVTDGVVHATSDAAKKVSYADLIGGRFFNVHLDWNGQIRQSAYAPARRSRRIPRSQNRRPADQSAKTSRRKCSRRKTSSRISRCRAWCTVA